MVSSKICASRLCSRFAWTNRSSVSFGWGSGGFDRRLFSSLPWTRSERRAPQTAPSGTSPSPDASSPSPAPPDRWCLKPKVYSGLFRSFREAPARRLFWWNRTHRWPSSASQRWSPPPAGTENKTTLRNRHQNSKVRFCFVNRKADLIWEAAGHDVHLEGDGVHEALPPGQTVFIWTTQRSSDIRLTVTESQDKLFAHQFNNVTMDGFGKLDFQRHR